MFLVLNNLNPAQKNLCNDLVIIDAGYELGYIWSYEKG